MRDMEQAERESGSGKVVKVIAAVVVLLLLVAIAIPNLMETKSTPCEASFIAALRTIASAQELYKIRHGVYGTIQQLGEANMLDNVLAAATTPENPKSGYWFTLTVESTSYWYCIARPVEWGVTGERNGFISVDGEVYVNHTENSSEFTEKLQY